MTLATRRHTIRQLSFQYDFARDGGAAGIIDSYEGVSNLFVPIYGISYTPGGITTGGGGVPTLEVGLNSQSGFTPWFSLNTAGLTGAPRQSFMLVQVITGIPAVDEAGQFTMQITGPGAVQSGVILVTVFGFITLE